MSTTPRNALGQPHGADERPDLWTTTRRKALRRAARAAGLRVVIRIDGAEVCDPATGACVRLTDPAKAAAAIASLRAARDIFPAPWAAA